MAVSTSLAITENVWLMKRSKIRLLKNPATQVSTSVQVSAPLSTAR